jgi:hypothetical protein
MICCMNVGSRSRSGGLALVVGCRSGDDIMPARCPDVGPGKEAMEMTETADGDGNGRAASRQQPGQHHPTVGSAGPITGVVTASPVFAPDPGADDLTFTAPATSSGGGGVTINTATGARPHRSALEYTQAATVANPCVTTLFGNVVTVVSLPSPGCLRRELTTRW